MKAKFVTPTIAIAALTLLFYASLRSPHAQTATATATGNQREIAIHGSAKKHENKLSSADVPGTEGGNLACAWAVNFVVKDGIGQEVGGGLSTAVMFEKLAAGRGKEVDLSIARPGSLVISPTEFRPDGSRNTGHVGILGAGAGDQRPIYSNSSNDALWKSNFTVGKWNSYYKVRKGLKVRTYSVNP
jgi:hypothetical protein